MVLKNTYILILAGGSGTRFWPLSRDARPKQLLNLFDEETLISKTVKRLMGIVPNEQIFILTNPLQRQAMLETVTEVPPENIIAEPAKRDTAPAVALGIGIIAAKNPEAVMMVLPADQLIKDTENFSSVMCSAAAVASRVDAMVTVGIKPTWASPSYGYIERGSEVQLEGIESRVFKVERFREKPAKELAESFLAQGNFSWNAGIFIWSVPIVRQELAQYCPPLAHFIDALLTADDWIRFAQDRYESLESISIDYALMESSQRIYNIEASFDWDDVGSWESVSKYLPTEGSNATNTPLVYEESSGNIVFSSSNKQVALLGVKDLIIVETADSLLVAHRNDSDQIKKIVSALPQELR